MYNYTLHQSINQVLQSRKVDLAGVDSAFFTRFIANATAIQALYQEIYGHHPKGTGEFTRMINTIADAYLQRSSSLKKCDEEKLARGNWFLSNDITGMSLYVDRFCGSLSQMESKLPYFKELGVNFLHLMPMFQSPEGESDGGYAVSDFRKLEPRFGTIEQLRTLQTAMSKDTMYLMLDIVLNHTSYRHEWAEKAKAGDEEFQNYFYFYSDRYLPDQFEQTMPDIFPESAPGSFTFVPEVGKWVMTVFHRYQWDLNYTNPAVFVTMLDTIFFYANLGVDILRIDAPAFIWKQLGTTCQNLPQAHTILRLIKQCLEVAAPGVALLGEAIVAPKEIMKYFGTGMYTARECDVAYNATHMALQWDALATGDTRVMLQAQHEILQKPFGSTWITYTRCHDDIGLGYDDYMIAQAGYNPLDHRKYLQLYFSGVHEHSPARGALFSVNPKNNDARISGSLASLCGLEKALYENNQQAVQESIHKIILMQAHSFLLGGIPMIFYGDELGYTNDYSYQKDAGKSYDNRWMHRPLIDWNKNERIHEIGTVEEQVFSATKKLISIRRNLKSIGDFKNLTWMPPHNIHVAGYLRRFEEQKIYAIFNFSPKASYLTWFAFREHGPKPRVLFDHWRNLEIKPGEDHEFLILEPYTFYILEAR